MSNKNPPKKMIPDKVITTVLPVITIFALFAFWEIGVLAGVINPSLFSRPTAIFQAFIFKLTNPIPDGSVLGSHILSSLGVSLSGLLIAILIGIPLGLVMGWYKICDALIRPIFEIVRPIPPVAWIPLTIIWIGVGLGAKAVIIFFSAFVPCVINAYTGIRQTNKVLINVAKTYGASNFWIFIHIGIPSAVPMMFAGLKIALSNSWGTLVAAEMLASSSGLGYMISMARYLGRLDIVILGMIVIGLFGYLFTLLFDKIQSKVMKGRVI